jgi:cellulose synthase/poly-beta-1,6-N-acetylglucosamine synthase-like glycosyltransferase
VYLTQSNWVDFSNLLVYNGMFLDLQMTCSGWAIRWLVVLVPFPGLVGNTLVSWAIRWLVVLLPFPGLVGNTLVSWSFL